MSDSLWPHVTTFRLLSLWDFPSKNTGVGCHFLLQGIFSTQGLNLAPCTAGGFFTAEPPYYHLNQWWCSGNSTVYWRRRLEPGQVLSVNVSGKTKTRDQVKLSIHRLEKKKEDWNKKKEWCYTAKQKSKHSNKNYRWIHTCMYTVYIYTYICIL